MAKGFNGGIRNYRQKITGLRTDLLPTVGDLMFESIVEGSAITGAPGQPVGEGDLKGSWRLESTPERVRVFSDYDYAVQNEWGVRRGGGAYVQHSRVGGRPSVALTRMGLQKIVNVAAFMVMDRNGGDAGGGE